MPLGDTLKQRRAILKRLAAILLLASVWTSAPARTDAQGQRPLREIPGFDFRPNGAFRALARRVAARRQALLARRDFATLNAALSAGARAGPAGPGVAVAGTFQIPAVLFTFRDTPSLSPGRDTANYTAVLFGSPPPAGRPYSERTFYEQISHGLLSLQGHALGYAALDSNEVYYAGTPGTCSGNPYGTSNCNGLFSSAAVASMQAALAEALRKVDATTDWSTFSYDSATGTVRFVIFVQPALDGACGGTTNNHFWSHRYSLQTAYTTHTPWPGHPRQYLQVSDYTLQSGVGGPTACDSTAIMPIGTTSEETGHAFGLPDLYDLSETSSGVGDWSLMSFGVYTAPLSPARLDAWSLSQLGWIALVPLSTSGTYTVGPVTPGPDTAFVVTVQDSNPRGEYFLLENRAGVLADTALIAHVCRVSGNPSGCGGGLLIWHADSTQLANTLGLNAVNEGPIHGLALLEADGARNLARNPSSDPLANRGDAGDPYPGDTGNTAFGLGTTPAATKNCCAQGFAGFGLDSIRVLAPQGPVAFRLQFFSQLVYTATPGGAIVASPAADSSGSYVVRDSPVTLTATATAGGRFVGWTGDTTAKSAALTLPMGRTYRVTANFLRPLATADVVAQLLTGTSNLTPADLVALDLLGNNNGRFDVGDFLAWVEATGAPRTAAPAVLRSASAPAGGRR